MGKVEAEVGGSVCGSSYYSSSLLFQLKAKIVSGANSSNEHHGSLTLFSRGEQPAAEPIISQGGLHAAALFLLLSFPLFVSAEHLNNLSINPLDSVSTSNPFSAGSPSFPGLSGLSGLFGCLGLTFKSNGTNQTDQMDEIDH